MSGTILLAEFTGPEALVGAVREVRKAGFHELEAYTPFPIDELPAALGLAPTRIRPVMLLGGLVAAIIAFATQTFSAVVHLPIDSGGRPLFSWPPFLVIAFEVGVLGAAFIGFGGLLIRSGLPRLHHPLFDSSRFERASVDRFFLEVRPEDDPAPARHLLERLRPVSIREVES